MTRLEQKIQSFSKKIQGATTNEFPIYFTNYPTFLLVPQSKQKYFDRKSDIAGLAKAFLSRRAFMALLIRKKAGLS
jgi:hypothetical protein